MLDASPHRKGFCLHRQPQPVQLLESVPSAVSHRQDHLRAFQDFLTLRRFQAKSGKVSFPEQETHHLGGKTHLSPQSDDPFPYGAHHSRQLISADMGFRLVEDLLRSARSHQFLQHLADAAVPGTGSQLAVGEGSSSSLAELNVALRVQNPLFPKTGDRTFPILHRFAPL